MWARDVMDARGVTVAAKRGVGTAVGRVPGVGRG